MRIEFCHIRPHARAVGRGHLEDERGARFRTILVVSVCSDDGDTIADCNGNTEQITRCSVVGYEFRQLRRDGRVRTLRANKKNRRNT